MYGADTTRMVDEDNSLKNPVTAYAKTKWAAEQALAMMNGEGFTTVFLRPSTVFGPSPKLRCDIVYNNLLAAGYTTGDITVDGSPWRPVVHVGDVCDAFIGAFAPAYRGGPGVQRWLAGPSNYTIKPGARCQGVPARM